MFSNETKTTIWTTNVIISLPICVSLILFTVLSNILVIYSIFTFPPLKKSQNLLLVSLAYADISCALFVMPVNLYWNLVGEWPFSRELCMLHLTSDSYFCTTSILNLVAIALDRYWAIFDPIKYTYQRTTRFIVVLAFITWITSFLIVVFPLIGMSNTFVWPIKGCDFPPGFILYLTSGQFGLPLVIMVIIYSLIYFAIKKKMISKRRKVYISSLSGNRTSISEETRNETMEAIEVNTLRATDFGQNSMAVNSSPNASSPEKVEQKEKISVATEKKAVKVFGIVVGVFVLCWMPFFVYDNLVYFWPVIGDVTPLPIINIIYWLGYVNSACNPVIYTLFNHEFRKALKVIFRIS